MRPKKFRIVRLLPSLIVGAVCIGALFSAVSAVSAWKEASAPHVGDLIAFNATGLPMRGKKIPVETKTHDGCILDLGTLRSNGGSFSVEAAQGGSRGVRHDAERFDVHWAGPHTSDGTGDCGTSAELVLSAQQIRLLTITSQSPVEAYPGNDRT